MLGNFDSVFCLCNLPERAFLNILIRLVSMGKENGKDWFNHLLLYLFHKRQNIIYPYRRIRIFYRTLPLKNPDARHRTGGRSDEDERRTVFLFCFLLRKKKEFFSLLKVSFCFLQIFFCIQKGKYRSYIRSPELMIY